jgi:hypothetical protein
MRVPPQAEGHIRQLIDISLVSAVGAASIQLKRARVYRLKEIRIPHRHPAKTSPPIWRMRDQVRSRPNRRGLRNSILAPPQDVIPEYCLRPAEGRHCGESRATKTSKFGGTSCKRKDSATGLSTRRASIPPRRSAAGRRRWPEPRGCARSKPSGMRFRPAHEAQLALCTRTNDRDAYPQPDVCIQSSTHVHRSSGTDVPGLVSRFRFQYAFRDCFPGKGESIGNRRQAYILG